MPLYPKQLAPRILGLSKKQGFDSVLELMSILHDLSISRNYRILSDSGYNQIEKHTYSSRRIEKVMTYAHQNFHKPITLAEVAKITQHDRNCVQPLLQTSYRHDVY